MLNRPRNVLHWMEIIAKPVTPAYAKHKIKAFKDYELDELGRVAAGRYTVIADGWKRDFPLLFLPDGSLKMVSFYFTIGVLFRI